MHNSLRYAVPLRYLVEAGADKDRPKGSGASPLYVASQNGHLDVVRYLVGAGASKAPGDGAGPSPVDVAVQRGRLDVVRYLIGEAGRCAPPAPARLHSLARQAPPAIAAWLTAAAGWSPLHFACDADCRPRVVQLLRGGASPAAAARATLGSLATRRLLRAAAVWGPSSHALFPPVVRRVARAALRLYSRCGRCRCGGRCRRCGPLAGLPLDLLLDALGFLPREPAPAAPARPESS